MRKRSLCIAALVGLLAPTVGSSADGSAKTTLAIKGMTCGGCVAAVKLQLKKTEGVTAYEVSLEKAEADVTYDPAQTTPEKIAASVSKTGFEATVRKGTAERTSVTAGSSKDCANGACERDCCQRPAAAAQNSEAAGLVSLASGSSRLAADFNGARTKRRFLAILSPTCGACVHGADAIKAAILPESEALDVFVVWAPMLEGDGSEPASASAERLGATGAKIQQYWDPERRVGRAFREDVFPDAVARMKRSIPREHFLEPYLASRDGAQPEWDIYLLFEPGIEWKDTAPTPSRWVRQTALLPGEGGSAPTSILWANDYSNAPVEGSLAEHLRRMVKPERRSAVR